MSDEPPKIRGGTKVRRDSESAEGTPTTPTQDEMPQPAPVPQGLPPPSPTAAEVGQQQDGGRNSSGSANGEAASAGRSSGGAASRSSADLSEVKNLLKQATEDIRQYKQTIKELEQEKSRLKDSNAINSKRLAKMATVSSAAQANSQNANNQDDSMITNATAAAGPSGGNGTTTSALKQKLQDLSIENHLAVEKIAAQQRRINELEGTVEAQNREMDKVRRREGGGGPIGGRKSVPAAGVKSPPHRSSSASGKATAGHGSPTNSRQGGASNSSMEDPPTTRERLPPRGHQFDPMASVQLAHPSGPSTTHPAKGPQPRVASASAGGGQAGQYDEMMMNRFRRSLAPVPKTEEMGEVVHAIVKQLASEMRKQGTLLPLTKVQPCVYKFPTSHSYAKPFPGTNPSRKANDATCFKKIHLTVDSGRLVVKGGGGHTDFMEYLERNHIAVPLA